MTWYSDLSNILEQRVSELEESVDGDTPEYRMSRLREIAALGDFLAKHHDVYASLVDNQPAGPFERITRGVT